MPFTHVPLRIHLTQSMKPLFPIAKKSLVKIYFESFGRKLYLIFTSAKNAISAAKFQSIGLLSKEKTE